jgi:hypothetical protein
MEMCNKCYIVHEERGCPLCEAKEEIKILERKIEILEKENS